MSKYPEYEYDFYMLGRDMFSVRFVSEIREEGVVYADRFEFKFENSAELAGMILKATQKYVYHLHKHYNEYI